MILMSRYCCTSKEVAEGKVESVFSINSPFVTIFPHIQSWATIRRSSSSYVEKFGKSTIQILVQSALACRRYNICWSPNLVWSSAQSLVGSWMCIYWVWRVASICSCSFMKVCHLATSGIFSFAKVSSKSRVLAMFSAIRNTWASLVHFIKFVPFECNGSNNNYCILYSLVLVVVANVVISSISEVGYYFVLDYIQIQIANMYWYVLRWSWFYFSGLHIFYLFEISSSWFVLVTVTSKPTYLQLHATIDIENP